MDNSSIADQFSLLSKLMDIHGENAFKAKSYASAAFAIDKLPVALTDTPAGKLASMKGIGESTAKKIIEIIQTGELNALKDIIAKTPAGVIEMLNIKGIGPKKIATIWKEMEIESLGELLYACNENRLTLFKGFGEKTQKNVQEAIEFYFKNQGSYLYAEAEVLAIEIEKWLAGLFGEPAVRVTGALRRQMETITSFELVVHYPASMIIDRLANSKELILKESANDTVIYKHQRGFILCLYSCEEQFRDERLFFTSCSDAFSQTFKNDFPGVNYRDCSGKNDKEIFEQAGIEYIPPFYREGPDAIKEAKEQRLPLFIQPGDIKGIIHSHSNWSDGADTIEVMAKACIAKKMEYLIISDHSKSAFYANGLSEERIREQHRNIDELNKQLAPFKIFKSIECDILNDGALDYSDNILSTFDLVIASVHSNLKMTGEKAMQRLLRAIENPYTTILGHMTGRLLLSRHGYPVDHAKIIDACAENKVVIELNAHPRRLDMDWRYIKAALQKKVLISINPDAHSVEGYADCRYGVLAAQKAGLTARNNLSSFSLKELEQYLERRKHEKKIYQ
jgi:DNA polymerase (family X)